ncbi:MAG: hypothetical protein GX759_02405 [Thermoanaerobacterales bacterium]|nr:hypothetical protein [Thermoanaerobacterales bacterium]
MKEIIDLDNVIKVKEEIEKLEGTNISLDSGENVVILKAGVKKLKDKGVLIYRYQITE